MIGAFVLLVATSTPTPNIDACADSAMFDPVAVGFGNGPLASVRRACARDEATFGASGGAIIRVEEFYGRIRAAGVLSASTALYEDLELFAALEVLHYEEVITSLSASHFGLGHLALGATKHVMRDDGTTLAMTAHTTLPTAFALYNRTFPFALDVGATGTTRLSPDLELHAYAGLRASIGVGAGPADPGAGVILDAGAAYRIASWFAVALDLEGAAGERAALDHVALGLGMRFGVADGLRFELSAKAPVAGDERSLASAYVGVAYWE